MTAELAIVAVLAVLAGMSLMSVVVLSPSPVLAEHKQGSQRLDCHHWLEAVLIRESRGDYQAVNEAASEYHHKWQTLGSYGGYQIAQPLWNDAAGWMAAEGLRDWRDVPPHLAPAIEQDAVAMRLCQRYHRCPWLSGTARVECWQRLDRAGRAAGD